MEKRTINAAIQIVPLHTTKHPYEIIDKAIECIQNSGVKYQVCPFETALEGEYEEVMAVIKECQEVCFKYGADEVLVNIKLQHRKNGSVSFEEKMDKYS